MLTKVEVIENKNLSNQKFDTASNQHYVGCEGSYIFYGQEDKKVQLNNVHWKLGKNKELSEVTYHPTTQLYEFSFSDGTLSKIYFNGVTLNNGNFNNVTLLESEAWCAYFDMVDFERCSLKGVDFSGNPSDYTSFKNSNFKSSKFENVDMRFAELTDIKFDHCLSISNINFNFATVCNVTGLSSEHLKNVSFRSINAKGDTNKKTMFKKAKQGNKLDLNNSQKEVSEKDKKSREKTEELNPVIKYLQSKGEKNMYDTTTQNPITQTSSSNMLALADLSSQDRSLLTANAITKILGLDWQDIPMLKAVSNDERGTWSHLLGVNDFRTQNASELAKKDSNGNTGLHVAALLGNVSAINDYASMGLTHNDSNNFYLTPLHAAIISGDSEGVAILLDHGASATKGCRLYFPLLDQPITVSALLLAVLLGHETVVKTIYTELMKQHKLNDAALTQCKELGNILHVAVVSCYANILEFLLTDPELREWAKYSLERTDGMDKTPLAYAAEIGNLDAIEWLVTAGANVNATNNVHKRTPLHYAVLGKQPLSVHLLIQLDANVNLSSDEPSPNKREKFTSKNALQLAEKLNSQVHDPNLIIIFQKLKNQTDTKALSLDFGTTGRLIYRNLIVQGGGVKGLAYVGALPILEQRKILKELHRVAGTSAGAITALLIALNFSSEEIGDILIKLTVGDLLGESGEHVMEAKKAIKKWLATVKENLHDPSYFKKGKGMGQAVWGSLSHIPQFVEFFKLGATLPFTKALSDGKALEAWLKKIVYEKLKADLSKLGYDNTKIALYTENLTFSRLKELIGIGDRLGYKNLYVFASDITNEEIVIFNSQEARWNHVNIVEAVCASAALPLAFTPRGIQIPSAKDPQMQETHYFVDGGLIRNRPIEYFDEMSFQNPYIDERWRYKQRTNKQTLALCLEEGEPPKPENLINHIDELDRQVEKLGLGDIFWRIGKIFYQAERLIQSLRKDIEDRSIIIHTRDVSTAEFDLVEDEERVNEIKAWGREETKAFFEPSKKRASNNNTPGLHQLGVSRQESTRPQFARTATPVRDQQYPTTTSTATNRDVGGLAEPQERLIKK